MTEEQARAMLQVTPEWIAAPCPWCGAKTEAEASEKCRPTQSICGDYYCGTPEEAPAPKGILHQSNPEHDRLSGYLWGWHAVHEGLTCTPPEWDEPNDD